MSEVAAIVLAAGRSSRMRLGSKLGLNWAGQPLVRHTVQQIRQAGFAMVYVVMGHEFRILSSFIDDLPVEILQNHAFELGLHSSIRAGLLAAPSSVAGYCICLADQPGITSDEYRLLSMAFDQHAGSRVIVPTFNGQRGNPVIIPARFRSEILKEPDRDRGCHYILERYPDLVVQVEMPRSSVLQDIDNEASYMEQISEI